MSDDQGSALLGRIRASMDSFTTAERKFARYVLATDDLVHRSITSVTDDSGSGYGTIIRFCQKLGFTGFQDFKINLAINRQVAAPEPRPKSASDHRIAAAADLARERIATTAAALDEAQLLEAARMLAGAGRILCIGVGGSFSQTLDLSYRLSRVGLDSQAVEDSHMQAIRATVLGPRDVLCAISFSGSAREILDAVALGRTAGAKVIAITNFPHSPLAVASHITLSSTLWEDAMETEIGSRLSFNFIIEVIGDLVMAQLPDGPALFRHTSESVAGKIL